MLNVHSYRIRQHVMWGAQRDRITNRTVVASIFGVDVYLADVRHVAVLHCNKYAVYSSRLLHQLVLAGFAMMNARLQEKPQY